MSNLIETMKIMHQLLRGEKTPEEIALIFKADPKRLAVYQNFVRHHILKALHKNFSSFRSLLENGMWDELVDEYFKCYPAHIWELNACTKEFPNFITSPSPIYFVG